MCELSSLQYFGDLSKLRQTIKVFVRKKAVDDLLNTNKFKNETLIPKENIDKYYKVLEKYQSFVSKVI